MSPRFERILKRSGEVVAYDRAKITDAIYKAAYAVGGHDRQLSERLALRVEEVLDRALDPASPPSVEEIGDVVEKVLIESGHARTSKAFILYRAERAQARARQRTDAPRSSSANIPYQVLYHVLLWNLEHECDSVEKVNERLRAGTYGDLVRDVDAIYEDDVRAAARQIVERRGSVRLVIVAGPSSSGKTTTTAKLAQYLRQEGLELVALNLDNYFYDLEVHPKDQYGDYDYEQPQALDMPLVNEHLSQLLKGNEVQMPRFDFPTGRRLPETDPLRVAHDQIVLVDSLHGLCEKTTEAIRGEAKFKLYIETLAQVRGPGNEFVRWADIRMMRRMARDSVHRGQTPVRTVGHWHYVRRSELKHIIPNVSKVDFILNSALPYEFNVLKKKLYPHLPEILAAFRDDPGKTDAYLRAMRVHDLLTSVETLEDDSCIPPTSLVREFVGGGIYGA